jgi:probable phosphoglycerate mutase
MSVFLLIRHGWTDLVGQVIPGRLPGVPLNATGRNQAQKLAVQLASVPIGIICSSPLERAMETAAPIAAGLGLQVRIIPDFTEIEFGDWSGRKLSDLEGEPRWHRFNSFRSGTRPPGGELMTEVQSRMVAQMEGLREQAPGAMIAVVSHGDPIKTAIAHYAGIPIDLMLRMEISPASVSILAVDDSGSRLLGVNYTMEWPGGTPGP